MNGMRKIPPRSACHPFTAVLEIVHATLAKYTAPTEYAIILMANKNKPNGVAWLSFSNGYDAIATPTIPIAILDHSTNETFRFAHKAANTLINKGFKATANVVIPGLTCCKAKMNIPRYNVVLRSPKIASCF